MSLEIDLRGVRVMLGMPCGPDIPWQTVKSLTETCTALNERGIPFELRLVTGCSVVQYARCYVAHHFMRSDKTHLFMLDSDIAWEVDDFLRLLALATKMPCVGAIYPVKREPTVFMLRWTGESVEANEYGCVPIKGMGLGFTIVQREVIERLSALAPKLLFGENPDPIPYVFRCDVEPMPDGGIKVADGAARGEDMAFFEDVRELGYGVWLDPAVSLGHVGVKVYSGSIRDAMRAA